MYTTRIEHPQHSRYTKLYAWMIKEVGFNAAAVLAEIEFLDLCEDYPDIQVATRPGLIHSLGGIVGKNAIDTALKLLIEKGWIRRHEKQVMGERNLQITYCFSLDAEAINQFLLRRTAGIPESGLPNSRNRDAGSPRSGPGSGTGSGTSTNYDEVDLKKEAAALPTAAAASESQMQKPPSQDKNHAASRGFDMVAGVMCWRSEPADLKTVLDLINKHGAEKIEAIAAALTEKNGKPPLPSQVVDVLAEESKRDARRALTQPPPDLPPLNRDAARQRLAAAKAQMRPAP